MGLQLPRTVQQIWTLANINWYRDMIHEITLTSLENGRSKTNSSKIRGKRLVRKHGPLPNSPTPYLQGVHPKSFSTPWTYHLETKEAGGWPRCGEHLPLQRPSIHDDSAVKRLGSNKESPEATPKSWLLRSWCWETSHVGVHWWWEPWWSMIDFTTNSVKELPEKGCVCLWTGLLTTNECQNKWVLAV